MFLREWTDPKQYDVIYGDAFNDLSVPYHLTTVEFNRIIASRLKPDGIYLANVIDKLAGGEFLKAYANSLRELVRKGEPAEILDSARSRQAYPTTLEIFRGNAKP